MKAYGRPGPNSPRDVTVPPALSTAASPRVRFTHQRKCGEPGVSLPNALRRAFTRNPFSVRCNPAGNMSHVSPLLCHSPTRIGLRHPHRSRINGPCRRTGDDDLYPRFGEGRDGGQKPPGPCRNWDLAPKSRKDPSTHWHLLFRDSFAAAILSAARDFPQR
jgi:hypothetical protein